MFTDLIQPGEPVDHRGIVVAPLFPRHDPVAAYITLDEALPRGLRIAETSDVGHACPSSSSRTRSTQRVLLYDGEELVGAKQNRILNVSVLVEAGAKLPIPVSCVEQGRWSRRSRAFELGRPHLARAAPPPQGGDARGAAARPRRRAERGLGRGAREADADARRLPDAARAATRSRRTGARLRALEDAFPLEPGQCGAVLALGDDLCLDCGLAAGRVRAAVAEAPAPATCSTRSSGSTAAATPASAIAAFVDEVAATPRDAAGRRPGSARTCACAATGVIGSGLELDGELLQLSAFTSDGGADRAFGRIARPSRRR